MSDPTLKPSKPTPSGHLYSFTCPNCGPRVEIQVGAEGTERKITCANCGSRLDGVTVETPAKDEPPPAPAQHECPYGGHGTGYDWVGDDRFPGDDPSKRQKKYHYTCGQDGWLCDHCKEDRADARARVTDQQVGLVERLQEDADLMRQQILDLQRELREWQEVTNKSRAVAIQGHYRLEAKVTALESRLPGPQTATQDLGTHDMEAKT